MGNIVLSQPGGGGTLTSDGYVLNGVRCYLSAQNVTALSWAVTAKPSGSAASAKIHPRLGWYFDPDTATGDYTIQLTDTQSNTHSNTFTVRPLRASPGLIGDAFVEAADYAVVGDDATDDLATWQAVFASLGSASTRMRSGHVVAPNRTSRISGTLLVRRFSGVLSGSGAGTSLNVQSSLKWAGAAGLPMLQLQQCWQARVEDLRIIGSTTAKPSSAVNLNVGSPESTPHNTGIKLSNLWIGSISGEDSQNGSQFTSGIVFNGQNLQNDQSAVDNCHIEGADDYGIDIQSSQSTIISVTNCKFNAMTAGVRTVSRGLVVENCFFSSLTDCVLLAGDSGVRMRNNGAEGCGRLLRATAGAPWVKIEGEYFQCNAARLPGNGAVVDIDGSGSNVHLIIEDMNFSSDGSLADGAAKIRVTNAAHATIVLRNVAWWDAATWTKFTAHFDVATASAGQTRLLVYDFKGVQYANYWTHGDTLTISQRNDFTTVPALPRDVALSGVDSAGNVKQLIQLVGSGAFANHALVGSNDVPTVYSNDLKATLAGLTLKDFDYITGLDYAEMDEIADPAAPAANKGRLFCRDNGSGKTQLCIRFNSGAVQVIATEP